MTRSAAAVCVDQRLLLARLVGCGQRLSSRLALLLQVRLSCQQTLHDITHDHDGWTGNALRAHGAGQFSQCAHSVALRWQCRVVYQGDWRVVG